MGIFEKNVKKEMVIHTSSVRRSLGESPTSPTDFGSVNVAEEGADQRAAAQNGIL